MEQNANALPKVTLGQYKGLEFTRRVRPVSEKAVELEAANLTRTHAPLCTGGKVRRARDARHAGF